MKDLGWLWHTLGGLAVGAVVTVAGEALGMGWAWCAGIVPALLLFGWVREATQHDPWLTRHQWVEAVCWPLGGALGFAGAVLFEALR